MQYGLGFVVVDAGKTGGVLVLWPVSAPHVCIRFFLVGQKVKKSNDVSLQIGVVRETSEEGVARSASVGNTWVVGMALGSPRVWARDVCRYIRRRRPPPCAPPAA